MVIHPMGARLLMVVVHLLMEVLLPMEVVVHPLPTEAHRRPLLTGVRTHAQVMTDRQNVPPIMIH